MGIVALAAAFFVTALLYASVGFGGGSTYSALLALAGFDYRLLPVLSLVCNIAVVAGSTIRFGRAGVMPWRGALVLTGIAAPAALLGGLTPIGEGAFFLLLGVSLILAGLALFVPQNERSDVPSRFAKLLPFAAAPLGYLSGLVGIGGGIFLAPLLHLTRWNQTRSIAATASVFILVNSLFGLAGQLLKNGPDTLGSAVTFGLPLMIAVVIGGQIGSLMALKILPPRVIRWLTAALTIWVGSRLLIGL
ncbi:sulfite exporter TauE/SafE family protein [Erythrobacter litoralis]|uniref:Probable membrane transporter protein n=1 Tax=Erythrobacter litoralis (strain HTCC2594) TaxID=314225 RepID=Q2NB29_ERYLH|nr:sulfite exporter TauE/SafE family protein [Erythrobacter litoralis]ABC63112.1 hypothetical protein ELI_05100 [Erythrobacter litoralis HTCC2594]